MSESRERLNKQVAIVLLAYGLKNDHLAEALTDLSDALLAELEAARTVVEAARRALEPPAVPEERCSGECFVCEFNDALATYDRLAGARGRERGMMTKEQALALMGTRFWEEMTDVQIATFQLHEDRLCMPFGRFHEAVEKALGRSVWTHEFADPESLREELRGGKPAPTMEDIINMIPAEKRIIIITHPRPTHD